MPPKPLIQSPTKRRAVIAAAMVVFMIGSLAWAALLSVSHRVDVGGLSVEVPRSWKARKADHQVFDHAMEFTLLDDPPETVTLGALAPGKAASLTDAAAAVLLDVAADSTELSVAARRPIHAGPLKGVQIAFVGRATSQAMIPQYLIAILTDESRYWAIVVQDWAFVDPYTGRLHSTGRNAALMEQVLAKVAVE
ncbi:MAG: hypothetical protein WD042_14680 [Phycisphaeraceae bacterium]